MNRKEAIKTGSKTYDGKPCKNCNTTEKYTSHWGCVHCSKTIFQPSKETRNRYEQSDKGKLVRRKINQSEAQKARVDQYNNSDKGKAATDRFYDNNPDKALEYRVGKYGLTAGEYNQMLTEQQECCKVCGTHVNDLSRNLHVDHNHETGNVRALLCHSCNTALGLLKEDVNIMNKLIEYVKDYNS